IFSSIFIPNISFWLDSSYFEKQLFRPTLHFWSLGVEIQYYILFPLILYFHKKHWLYSFTLMIASLALCIFLTPISSKTAFFLTPFRIWEFLIGFFVYQIRGRKPDLLRNEVLQGAIFFCCIYFFFTYSGIDLRDDNFPWPGAAPPVLVAAFVIFISFQPNNKFFHILFFPLALLGRMSYSVYLVHFVVFSFFIYKPFRDDPIGFTFGVDLIFALLVTALISTLVYRTVEVPFRNPNLITNNAALKIYFGALAGLAGLIVAIGLSGWSWRAYPEPIAKVFYSVSDRGAFRCGVLGRILEPTMSSCSLHTGGVDSKQVLLVGDSRMDSIKNALADAAETNNIQLFLIKHNCALGSGKCAVEKILHEISKRNVNFVILHSTARAIDNLAVRNLVSVASRSGVKIKLIYNTPSWDEDIPEAVYNAFREDNFTLLPSSNLERYQEDYRAIFEGLELIESDYLELIPVAHYFCSPNCKILDNEGYPIYYDNHHLTIRGSRLLFPLFDSMFQRINLNQ
ncbi:MAG: acyltransferase family protein, partial [bacterium]